MNILSKENKRVKKRGWEPRDLYSADYLNVTSPSIRFGPSTFTSSHQTH